MTVVAIRGATQVEVNSRDQILEATGELVTELLIRNDLRAEDLISVVFTVTPDLDAADPAGAAASSGLGDVPVMSTVEIAVPRALPRAVRILVHADAVRPRPAVEHVYLRGAGALRPDLARAVRP